MRRRRSKPRDQRGFALLVVVILLALMTAATALALDNAVATLRSHAGVRASEMVKSALDFGVAQAMAQLQQDDVASIVDPRQHPNLPGAATSFDIFDDPTGGAYVPATLYPPTGQFANHYSVRVGMRAAQRGRAPTGEDVRKGYGQIVEIQVEVQAVAPGVPPAEERVTVGVMIPRRDAHSN